jgi:hypothetical protein
MEAFGRLGCNAAKVRAGEFEGQTALADPNQKRASTLAMS